MSSEVIIGAGPTRQRMSAPTADARSSPVSTDISRPVVAPRLLTSATFGPGRVRAASRASMASIACRAVLKRMRSTPASPWMPSPSSEWPGSIRSVFGEPGMVQVSSDMPIETVPAIVWRAAAATVSRSPPPSASAPAILCTKRVPAMPRGCGRSGSATSSSTITISTRSPKARARSAASPKFSRSPV